MSAVDMETVGETEAERVERWREEELERAGYAPGVAHELALRPEIDLHIAVDLLQRGCSEELALEILL